MSFGIGCALLRTQPKIPTLPSLSLRKNESLLKSSRNFPSLIPIPDTYGKQIFQSFSHLSHTRTALQQLKSQIIPWIYPIHSWDGSLGAEQALSSEIPLSALTLWKHSSDSCGEDVTETPVLATSSRNSLAWAALPGQASPQESRNGSDGTGDDLSPVGQAGTKLCPHSSTCSWPRALGRARQDKIPNSTSSGLP